MTESEQKVEHSVTNVTVRMGITIMKGEEWGTWQSVTVSRAVAGILSGIAALVAATTS